MAPVGPVWPGYAPALTVSGSPHALGQGHRSPPGATGRQQPRRALDPRQLPITRTGPALRIRIPDPQPVPTASQLGPQLGPDAMRQGGTDDLPPVGVYPADGHLAVQQRGRLSAATATSDLLDERDQGRGKRHRPVPGVAEPGAHADQLYVQAIGSRPKIAVSTDGTGVVGHAGARLLADLAEVTGLTGAYSDVLRPLRPRGTGHDPGRVATDLAMMLADGGEALTDLAVLRDQCEVFGPVASTPTAWRLLADIDASVLARLRTARASAREVARLQAADRVRAYPPHWPWISRTLMQSERPIDQLMGRASPTRPEGATANLATARSRTRPAARGRTRGRQHWPECSKGTAFEGHGCACRLLLTLPAPAVPATRTGGVTGRCSPA